ncbi:MAG: Asp-tRNA(Asn)/Glu-tRNA(Gln) amidotransferase subunit GatB [Actinobacteria bacterium]|nr:Asp-tRNA(Asn)/Glu-tRNA(Gln) amidotransferase subunit GatB [Actinomycetota bacterium]
MNYEPVIGLEIHVELLTRTKMFCGCPTTFGAEPNTLVCPVCLALPGTLPVINRRAVEYALIVGLALNCEVGSFTQFHRKNYFYPDLPKGYQISQYDYPLARSGYLDLEGDSSRGIGITRVHLEEDTAKLIHPGDTGRITEAEYSLVDFNRAGIPLLEIVSEPDIHNTEDARLFMVSLRDLLRYLGVSDCNLEEGSMRCDANISVRRRGESAFGVKTEIKNINSFKSLVKGLEYEVKRQIDALEHGDKLVQETRHFDSRTGKTSSLRSKEYAHDYRYFPEPDLVPMNIKDGYVHELRSRVSELPQQRIARYQRDYDLSKDQAELLASNPALCEFFEESAAICKDYRSVYNWIFSEVSAFLNEKSISIGESRITPQNLVELIMLINQGRISGKIAKEVAADVFESGRSPIDIVESRGLTQISDESGIKLIIDEVIGENPKAVQDFRSGKTSALAFLVGQVMRKSRGRANPDIVNSLLQQSLKE